MQNLTSTCVLILLVNIQSSIALSHSCSNLLSSQMLVLANSSINLPLQQTRQVNEFEERLLRNPHQELSKLRTKIMNNDSVRNEFSLTLAKMVTDLNEALPKVPASLKNNLDDLIKSITSDQNLTALEMTYLAGEYTVFMDLKYIKNDNYFKKYVDQLYDRPSYEKYYEKRSQEIHDYITETIMSDKVKLNLGLIVPVPSFKELSMSDFVRTTNVMWLGLSDKPLFFDGSNSLPSQFFAHDINHGIAIKPRIYNAAKFKYKLDNNQLISDNQFFDLSNELNRNALAISNYINKEQDQVLAKAYGALLFELSHEKGLPIYAPYLIQYLTDTLVKKNGAYRTMLEPGYTNEMPAIEVFDNLSSGFYGNDGISLANKLKRNSWRQVQIKLIALLRNI